ncbi:carbonate dehydratase [Anaeromyxobacter diazotrophicus]|uniref:Carbonic anhydrase 2 n=1 Tax=Anaeromyxobacter diazotrophicus TaxID=2590199 RepID=A0A7I9VGU1_9BACT|nr:carbonate dehydratase [Anaeromyxobacter diazotrophicus]GEJ55459.1 carbonic anhydrase [Anaeromyxobacter diazotrophicus]
MKALQSCFEANRAWSARMRERDPGFFERLVHAQRPELLWIGCSDSRLPPDQVVGRLPGEIFVHRNVGNVVVHTDLNCLSVLQYGIEVLGVKHVIVCGHYGCGGVAAAMSPDPRGLIDNWLRHVRDVYMAHRDELERLDDPVARQDRLCELNVAAQVANVCHTTIVQDAWRRGQPLAVHGWIYTLADGLLHDLDLVVQSAEQVPAAYRMR